MNDFEQVMVVLAWANFHAKWVQPSVNENGWIVSCRDMLFTGPTLYLALLNAWKQSSGKCED